MPNGHCTKQFPLHTSTIDESSISGNIAVANNVYINQLKMTHEELANQAVPSLNDQSTNLGFGLFHLTMNLIWALLHVHRGSIHQIGSLSYFFALLNWTRLGCKHPDYHTLLSTLLQILHGIILDAWKVDPPPKPTESEDLAHYNLSLLTRNLRYVLELTKAIPTGDFGCVKDMLGNLMTIFRGAGSNNYSTEILHWIYNMKNVWIPQFVDIMRDNMLVNPSGLKGHWMPIDLNIEHHIKFLKLFYTAKGIHASWDRLADISASIDLLQNVRKWVSQAFKTAYSGTTHMTPDVSSAIRRVALEISKLELHKINPDHDENNSLKPVINTIAIGERKLKASSLTTFNQKVQGMMARMAFDVKEDGLPPAVFDLSDSSKNHHD
ncbi:hypothetical protein JVU11DRAFT_7024 [Chiua virens]|nr:hypothetical protein JVU11DRAFT_7024 [Chiua virens]